MFAAAAAAARATRSRCRTGALASRCGGVERLEARIQKWRLHRRWFFLFPPTGVTFRHLSSDASHIGRGHFPLSGAVVYVRVFTCVEYGNICVVFNI
jgi:hypothetical protein